MIEGIAVSQIEEAAALRNAFVRLSRAIGSPGVISVAEGQPVEAGLIDAAVLLLTANPTWNEARERELFENRSYAHYERTIEARRAKGQSIAFPNADGRPWSREELFERKDNGDYVAIAYQQAWGGWRLARGGL